MADNMASMVAQKAVSSGIKSTVIGILVNILLAIVKGLAGLVGNSYALVADAIESASDVLSSLVIIAGLKLSSRPPDENHPYGHGKFEPLATVLVSCTLFGAAILIAVESVHGIVTPHEVPAPFTLLILALVVVTKEWLFRFVLGVAESANSGAIKTDAWHHRSDAISSLAAFVGISIALCGGKEYACADDFAALVAAMVICLNAILLLMPALAELMDTRPDPEIANIVRTIAEKVPGVLGTHKCHVRKLGFDYFVDLDVLCDPSLTIREGHDIAHDVGDVLHRELPQISRILVHVEPVDDYGRRSRG